MARQFILEDNGRYYIVQAILEYDPDKAQTAEEQEAVRRVAAMYAQARKSGTCYTACELDGGGGAVAFGPLNTGPGIDPGP